MDPSTDPSLLPWITSTLWWLLAWVVAVFLLTAGAYMVAGPALRQGRAEARVARAIRKAGLPAVHDIVLRGPAGGLCQIDHVVRLPSGLVVLETCMRAGRLVGRTRARVWRQDLGLETYTFGNPLRRLDRAMGMVRRTLRRAQDDESIPVPLVTGQVLVPGRTRFARGRPDGVSPLASFLEDLVRAAEALPAREQADPEAVEAAWRALNRAALTRTPDGDGPAAWHAVPRRALRHLLADPRSATGLVFFVVGVVMALTLLARGMP